MRASMQQTTAVCRVGRGDEMSAPAARAANVSA
jgi:hypothetical protein